MRTCRASTAGAIALGLLMLGPVARASGSVPETGPVVDDEIDCAVEGVDDRCEEWVSAFVPGGLSEIRPTSVVATDQAVFLVGREAWWWRALAYDQEGTMLWDARVMRPGSFPSPQAALSPDGTRLYLAVDFGAVALDAGTGETEWVSMRDVTNKPDRATDLVVSPDGSTVFVTGYSETFPLSIHTMALDASTGAIRWDIASTSSGGDLPNDLAVSPDGQRIFVVGERQSAKCVGCHPQGLLLAYDAGSGALLWDRAPEPPPVWCEPCGGPTDESIAAAVVSQDGSTLFVTGHRGALLVAAIDTGTGATRWLTATGGGSGTDLLLTPSGDRLIVSASQLNSVDPASGAVHWTSGYGGAGLALSPDGSEAYSTGWDGASLDLDWLVRGFRVNSHDVLTTATDTRTGTALWTARYRDPDNPIGDDRGIVVAVGRHGGHLFVGARRVNQYRGGEFLGNRAQGWMGVVAYEVPAVNQPPNQPPTASFTVSCAGRDCRFDATGSSDPDGAIEGYAWDFGDGAGSQTGPVVDHRYPEGSESFVATLTVTDDRGGTDSESQTVRPQPPNQLPAARLSVSCVKTNCTFSGGASSDPDGQITGYAWDFGDGTSSQAGPSVQHRYPEGPANYVVTLTVTDDRGGTDTESLTVRCIRKNQNKPTTCS